MSNYKALATQAARAYGIDPSIFLRQINQESGFNPRARSSAGALGIAQFMPATARSMGVNPLNPKSALYGAAKMDARNLAKYHNWQDVLSLYNSGRGWAQGRSIGQTRNYVQSILGGANPTASLKKGLAAMATGAAPSPSPADNKTSLLQFVMASNDAYAHGQQAPSIVDFLKQNLAQATTTPQAAVNVSFHKMTPSTQKAIGLVQEAIGTPYVWGGESKSGFDCSGLLQYAWGKAGVSIPRTTYDQWKVGKQVGRSQLQAGDAVFFKGSDSKNGLPGHVGMYIGGGKFIEAPHTGAKVRISTLNGRSDYMGARRYN